jgi:exoribonuclease-2
MIFDPPFHTHSGTSYAVRAKDVVYVLPGAPHTPTDLADISTQAAANLDPSLLALAWELSDPGTALYSVEEMAELLYGDTGPASCAASHRLLRDDKLYFKQAGRAPPMYAARPASQVTALRQQAEAEAVASAALAAFVHEIHAAKKAPRACKPGRDAWLAGDHASKVLLLEEFALGRPMAAAGQATVLLRGIDISPTPQGAADLLQASGFWPPHVQLGLLASNMTERFGPELEAAAAGLVTSPPPDADAASRQDLTALSVITIDDASTTEIDDGLSAEEEEGGKVRVWVHVADPTRWIDPGSALDREARRRSMTLYLPTGMVPMFPLSLAEGPFSLREGEESHALTVTAVIDQGGCNWCC